MGNSNDAATVWTSVTPQRTAPEWIRNALAATAAAFVMAAGAVHAAELTHSDIVTMACSTADYIVVADVSEPTINSDDLRWVTTEFGLTVVDTLKTPIGGLPEPLILGVPGGTTSSVSTMVSKVTTIEEGHRYLLYLAQTPVGVVRLHYGSLTREVDQGDVILDGHYRIEDKLADLAADIRSKVRWYDPEVQATAANAILYGVVSTPAGQARDRGVPTLPIILQLVEVLKQDCGPSLLPGDLVPIRFAEPMSLGVTVEGAIPNPADGDTAVVFAQWVAGDEWQFNPSEVSFWKKNGVLATTVPDSVWARPFAQQTDWGELWSIAAGQ